MFPPGSQLINKNPCKSIIYKGFFFTGQTRGKHRVFLPFFVLPCSCLFGKQEKHCILNVWVILVYASSKRFYWLIDIFNEYQTKSLNIKQLYVYDFCCFIFYFVAI